MDHEPDPDTLLNIKATAKALGVKANDMKQIDSEMHYNSSEYSAVEKAFRKVMQKISNYLMHLLQVDHLYL